MVLVDPAAQPYPGGLEQAPEQVGLVHRVPLTAKYPGVQSPEQDPSPVELPKAPRLEQLKGVVEPEGQNDPKGHTDPDTVPGAQLKAP